MMCEEILLLHGALGSQAQFAELKQQLAPHFKVHTFNFSGHGNNSSEKEFSMDLFEQDVLHYMKAHSLEPVCIFGYSMGGYVALKLAIDHPEKVKKLMTLGTKIQWDPETAKRETSRLDPKKMSEKIPKFVELLKQEHHPNDWGNIVHKTAAMMHDLGNGKALDMKAFARIEVPVLIALGSEDNMVTRQESKELTAHLTKGDFMEITGFKHPIGQVDQKMLANIMIDFFQ